jgi:hypothetical protein
MRESADAIPILDEREKRANAEITAAANEGKVDSDKVQAKVTRASAIVGANPNALARARSDGLILDSHLEKFPRLAQMIEKSQGNGRPVFSFPSTQSTPSTPSTSRENFMNKLNLITGRSGIPTSKAAFDRLEMTRRDGTDDEIFRAISQARIATALEHRDGPDAIELFLRQPGHREYWNALARFAKGKPVSKEAKDYSTDGPGQLAAAFGCGDSYLVNLSEQFIIESSPFAKWNSLQEVYRAYARVYCETREATGLATLTTAPR